MKRFIAIIIDIIVHIIRILFTLRTLHIIKSVKRKLYSSWIAHEFAHCGKDCSFDTFDALIGAKKMDIGDNVIIGKNCVMELYDKYGNCSFDAHLSIGDNTKIGPYNHISCVNSITIGNDVLFGRRVFVTDNAHGKSERKILDTNPDLRPVHSKGPVVIEDCVWIGENVCIMPNVVIGRGSIIGANAVVTKDIPPYSVAAGVPARIIKSIEI